MHQYKNTFSGRQHWMIYGCFDESSAEPVAIKFYGTEYQAQKLSYALACAFNTSPYWNGHTLAVNGHVYNRTWRGEKVKKNIHAWPSKMVAS